MNISGIMFKYRGWCPGRDSFSGVHNMMNEKNSRVDRRFLPVFGFVIIVIGLLAFQGQADQERDYFTFIDDVSIIVDDVIHFRNNFSSGVACGSGVFRSPPSGFTLRCSDIDEGEFGEYYPDFDLDREWNKLNVTWYANFPSERRGQEFMQQFDIYISDPSQTNDRALSRVFASIEFVRGVPQIGIGVVYFDDSPSCPPDYHDDVEIDFSSDEWHEVTFLIIKPQFLVYIDDEPVIETSIFSEYLGDDVDFRWRSFYTVSP